MKLIILAAPSGAGKNTFLEKAVEDFENLYHSISYTSRPPRKGESEGVPYHFLSIDEFRERIEKNFFIEWAKVHGNYYGTAREDLQKMSDQGKWVIMDLDIQGTRNIKAEIPEAVSIFILPPSVDELRKRLEKRDQGETDNLQLRLNNAVDEMLMAPEFDYQVVNDEIHSSYANFRKILEEILKSE